MRAFGHLLLGPAPGEGRLNREHFNPDLGCPGGDKDPRGAGFELVLDGGRCRKGDGSVGEASGSGLWGGVRRRREDGEHDLGVLSGTLEFLLGVVDLPTGAAEDAADPFRAGTGVGDVGGGIPRHVGVVPLNSDAGIGSNLRLEYPGGRSSSLSERAVSFLEEVECVESCERD